MSKRVLVLAICALPSACGQLLAVDEYDTSADARTAGDARVDTRPNDARDSSRVDARPDTSVTDADPCATVDLPGDAVFVSGEGGSDETGDGSSALPVKTIARGISLSVARSASRVVLEVGVYHEAIVLDGLVNGLFIEGGFERAGSSWSRSCEPSIRGATRVEAPTLVGVHVQGLTKPSGLAHLTISTEGTAAFGESSMGVVVIGPATFRLEDVAILSSRGGDGAPPPLTPGAELPTCNGITDCSMGAASGADGGDGRSGVGAFSAAGYLPGHGEPGSRGGRGGNGRPGAAGAASFLNECDQPCGPTCQIPPKTTVFAASGTCGCGGVGGPGGAGGGGGGASVGLFVYGPANVDLVGSSIASSDGGLGRGGAPGAVPSPPTPGIAGESRVCFNGGCVSTMLGCRNAGVSKTIPGGAAGESGAPGGKGGTGGGGAGGPSFALLRAHGANVTLDATTTLSHGVGGAGGDGAFATASDQGSAP